MRKDAGLERGGIRHSRHEPIEGGKVHDRVDQHVRPASKRYEIPRRRRIARNNNRAIRRVEAIGESRHDWRVLDERSSHSHLLVVHHCPTGRELVWVHERPERHSPFVRDADVDVVLVHLEKQTRHSREGRRPPGVDARVQPRGPCEPDEVPIVRVVVRVLMRDEHMAQRRQRDTGRRELTRDAISAIDDVRDAAADDHLS